MPKHEAGSAKAIAIRQKLVGLQKLRWYCQMCQKQCRDENGFKCHTMSEGHLRQMRLFSQNSGSILDQFSQDFESGFLRTLSHLHGTKRVMANRVYQEYIADKHHIHMNATAWTTLTGFCKHLGKEGKAIVDETEKGWFIQYVDRDPALLAKQQEFESRKREELEEEDRQNKLIGLQIKQAQAQLEEEEQRALEEGSEEEAEKDKDAAPVRITLCSSNKLEENKKKRAIQAAFGDEDDEEEKKKEELEKQAAQKKMKSYEDFQPLDSKSWLLPGALLKVVNKKLHNGAYYGLKGEVLRVLDAHTCKLLVDGREITVQDDDVQTVVPHVGERGLVLRGPHKGKTVVVKTINKDKFNCDVDIIEERGTTALNGLDYEDFSKCAHQNHK